MNKIMLILIVGIIAVAIGATMINQRGESNTTNTAQIKKCITEVTGTPEIDIEEILQEDLFKDIYRYCLKTTKNIEKVLLEIAN